MLGHSPPVSQAGRRIGSPLAFGLIGVGFPPTIKTGEFFWMFFHVHLCRVLYCTSSQGGDGIFFWPVAPKKITTLLFPVYCFLLYDSQIYKDCIFSSSLVQLLFKNT
jgi:hypothetical protein